MIAGEAPLRAAGELNGAIDRPVRVLGIVDRNEDFAIHRDPLSGERAPLLSPGPVPSAGSVQLISTRDWVVSFGGASMGRGERTVKATMKAGERAVSRPRPTP